VGEVVVVALVVVYVVVALVEVYVVVVLVVVYAVALLVMIVMVPCKCGHVLNISLTGSKDGRQIRIVASIIAAGITINIAIIVNFVAIPYPSLERGAKLYEKCNSGGKGSGEGTL
jgi:hypothetical protein